jgi:hypothetical protein
MGIGSSLMGLGLNTHGEYLHNEKQQQKRRVVTLSQSPQGRKRIALLVLFSPKF